MNAQRAANSVVAALLVGMALYGFSPPFRLSKLLGGLIAGQLTQAHFIYPLIHLENPEGENA